MKKKSSENLEALAIHVCNSKKQSASLLTIIEFNYTSRPENPLSTITLTTKQARSLIKELSSNLSAHTKKGYMPEPSEFILP